MNRGLLVAALPLVLGGCLPALPPAISLASTGLTGFAFLTTGKSTTDHVLSAAVDEDCSMLRVVFGDKPCRAYENEDDKPLTEVVAYYPGDDDGQFERSKPPHGAITGSTQIAFNFGSSEETVAAASTDAGASSAELEKTVVGVGEISGPATLSAGLDVLSSPQVAGFAPVSGPDAPQPIKIASIGAPVGKAAIYKSAHVSWREELAAETPQIVASVGALPAASDEGMAVPMLRPYHVAATVQDHFVMLGSFRDLTRAEFLKQQIEPSVKSSASEPVIMSVRLKGVLWHRVALGPFTGHEAVAMAKAMPAISGKKPWAAKVSN